MKSIHILNLGAGVQSTTLYLLGCDGKLPMDYAIFADTGDEPVAVYHHLEWLKQQRGPEIIVASKGCLGDDLMHGQNSTGQRFASIPAFTQAEGGGRVGMTRRQCSKEYKIEVIQRAIREQIVGLKRGQRFPVKDTKVVQYIGISIDEAGRAKRIGSNPDRPKWTEVRFPLIEKNASRSDCVWFLKGRVPHETPRSACVYCPYHTDEEWLRIKQNPVDWARAVEVDEGLRAEGSIINRNLEQKLYMHRSCQPLVQIEFKPKASSGDSGVQNQLNFQGECLGVCGL